MSIHANAPISRNSQNNWRLENRTAWNVLEDSAAQDPVELAADLDRHIRKSTLANPALKPGSSQSKCPQVRARLRTIGFILFADQDAQVATRARADIQDLRTGRKRDLEVLRVLPAGVRDAR